jgi:hypothetical protein
MNEDLEGQMNEAVSRLSGGFEAAEITSYAIWGAAVTATRAFEKVAVKIDPNTARIFVSIELRWWARFKRFALLQSAWLKRAEKRCKEHTPDGFKILVYYDKGKKK